jgi:tripeptide aminopeptidase
MTVTERFLGYVSFDTQSSDESFSVPSTPGQMTFARHLKEELEREGLEEVTLDNNGYLYATLPASPSSPSGLPVIGFISHYDTSPDSSGANIKPRIVKNYDGGDIVLSPGMVTSPQAFPELLAHRGEDLIVTDGHTLLGADDKAGIAEIVQAMVWLKAHPEVEHGKIRVAFTPDEEIGRGADHFDVDFFGCQWAYTVDGGEVGELEYENFNAAVADIVIKGVSVHPGSAKGRMVNASLLAAEFIAMLPADERPETTDGYEGFFHVTAVTSSCEMARLSIIVRDHDSQTFNRRKHQMMDIAGQMNGKYGAGVATVALRDQYFNMKEMIVPENQHVVDLAVRAMREAGVEPKIQPIRGGTDGALLSFLGLPCPNIFAGGLFFHGPHETLPIQSMEKAVEVIINICKV